MQYVPLMAISIFFGLAFFSATIATLMLIPGHFILSLVCRIARVENRKEFDRRGKLSLAIGFVFWGIILEFAYAWIRFPR